MKTISEIQIIPVKPDKGLVGFCSFILYESVYCSSVAIFTRPDGNYRLVYPTKKLADKDINIFHPISRSIGKHIEQEVIKKFNDVMNNDRYNFDNLTTR
jgi:stage V sporulation protein G